MKTEKTRILFIENVEANMDSAIRELQKDNVNYNWVRVETRDTFEKQIRDFNPDVVVCNYAVPGFNGLEALKTTLSTAQKIPVILISGPTNEETAVACIKAGATDYMLRDNLKRLPSAVTDALTQAEVWQERSKADHANMEWDANYRTLLESTNDTAFLKNEEFRYVMANKAIKNFLGKDAPDIHGKTDFDLLPNETATRIRQADTKTVVNRTELVTTEQIGNRTFETRRFPVTLPNGKTGVGGFIHEITSQVGEETWRKWQSTSLYSMANAIVISDPHGTILSVNPAYTKLTGYTTEESVGKNMIDVLKSSVHNEEFYVNLWGTILKGNVWRGEITNRRKDGTLYNEEMTITPVRDNNGNVTQFVSVKQDVTDRKLTVSEAETTVRDYRQLLDNAVIGTFTTTLEGEITQVNDSLCTILECPGIEKMKETRIHNIFKHPEQWNNLVNSLLTTDTMLNTDIDLVTVNGNDRYVVMNAILENNRIMGIVLDMTKHRKIETELLRTMEKAEESDKLKTTFLANMSHELRIPINSIQGFTGLLTSSDLNSTEKTEYIEKVSRSSQQLLKLINDYAEITKIVSGQITASPVSFELNTLIKDVYTEYAPAASRKNLLLTYHLGLPDTTSYIRFDDLKLRHVLSNLIDNAIKFNDAGSVDFGYELKDSILEVYVKDTGRGIGKDYQNVIFERFRKLDDPYTRKSEGPGLGLSIAKAYVEFLGGKIWVNSQTGRGSNFTFSIPYLPVEAPSKTVREPQKGELNLHKRTILVVEDDETNFEYMERLLAKADAIVLRASNGQEAVERCTSGSHIDLVLMDINMPMMNGLEATRLIKNASPEMPIIAVTAYALSGDRESCISAGCDDYIPKPIARDELFTKLGTLFAN